MQKQYYSYDNFRVDTKKLIKMLQKREADAILGVARGGLTLAHSVAEGLDIRRVESLRTELYDGACKRDTLSLVENCSLEGVSRVVVVDDIADSGETLEAVMRHLNDSFPKIEFVSATLFYKKSSCFKPDFWIHEAKEWIEFFWEADFKI